MSFENSRSVHNEPDRRRTSFEDSPEFGEIVNISSSPEDEKRTDYLNIRPPQSNRYQDASNTNSHLKRSERDHKRRRHHSYKEKRHRRKYLRDADNPELLGREGRFYPKCGHDEGNSVSIQRLSKRMYSEHRGDGSRSCRHVDYGKEDGCEACHRKRQRVERHKTDRRVGNDGEKLRMCVDEKLITYNIRKDAHHKAQDDDKNYRETREESTISTEMKFTQQPEDEQYPEQLQHLDLQTNAVAISDSTDSDVEVNAEKNGQSHASDPPEMETIDSVQGTELSDSETNENTIQDLNEVATDEELLPYYPAIQGCRSVNEFQLLNHVEEGTYGVVYRAIDKRINEIVALKRLKMEKEKEGFPITSLREINTLLKGQHSNIVTVREIVVGNNMDKIYIVMDFVEHDLKSVLETMRHKKQKFNTGKVKCLLKQLLYAVAYLHDNWILHRDLKPSNLLLSSKGILKVGDFGLAREYGSPLKAYTPVVVTLWYRSPELLLCTKQYSTPIDVWSVGCIFGELQLMNPVFPGKSEVDQLNKIFKALGTPDESVWPGFNNLPAVQRMKFIQYFNSSLKSRFHTLSVQGYTLLQKFLTYDPVQRITAEKALQESYFSETPLPVNPSMLLVSDENGLEHTASPKSVDEELISQLLKAAGDSIDNAGLPTDVGFRLKF